MSHTYTNTHALTRTHMHTHMHTRTHTHTHTYTHMYTGREFVTKDLCVLIGLASLPLFYFAGAGFGFWIIGENMSLLYSVTLSDP